MDDIVELYRQEWPAVFAGTSLDGLSGKAIIWGTIQNKRSRREIPDECFCRSGTRVLIIRDPFLSWWQTTLHQARQQPGAIRNRRDASDGKVA
jgi:hypothetical protein